MYNKYVVIVRRKSADELAKLDHTCPPTKPIAIGEYNKSAFGFYQSNVLTASQWRVLLRDKYKNKPHYWTNQSNMNGRMSIQYCKYWFANITTDFQNPATFGDILECPTSYGRLSRDVTGNLSNFREITDQDLFTLWITQLRLRYLACSQEIDMTGIISEVSRLYMPQSMQTYTFLKWIQDTYPDVKWPSGIHVIALSHARIMTGEQFNAMYKDKFVRLLTQDMNHNGFQWRFGTNVCTNFCPVTSCNYGLYFIKKCNINSWRKYSGKTMYWQCKVIVPNHAIVKLDDDKCAASELIIHSPKLL